ncbi:hypothetical protein IEI92_31565 [Microbispora bryophytorum]|nr:hypothetical protein [Microbispora bryophytorum]MBD3140754.1 hypothetical protein [Microbispora bryophytorum]
MSRHGPGLAVAAAMLIAAATACSNGDSTKVFNAGNESTAQGSASSPGSPGAPPGNANAAGLSATQTATAAAAPAAALAGASAGEDSGRKGEEAADAIGDTTVAEKIGDIAAAPSPRPSPLPSPGLSSGPRATPAPTTGTETEPPMRLAQPVRTADRPVVVNAIEPEDVPRADRSPAQATPGGANGAGRQSSPPPRAPSPTPRAPSATPLPPSATPLPPAGASAAGWSDPALAEDFGGQALRLAGGAGADLSGTPVQQYGRWEIRLRAEQGALPVALLQSAQSGAAQDGEARRGAGSRTGSSRTGDSRYERSRPGESRYGASRYGDSRYDAPRSDDSRSDDSRSDDSWRDDSEYAGPQDGVSQFGRTHGAGTHGAGTENAQTEDAAIGVAGIAGGRRAELSVRQGRELARAELGTDLTQWHTVAVDWLPGRVTFWLDGRQVWNYTGPYVPRSRMGLVLRNDASGGTVYVDSVRVYLAPQR